MGILDTIKESLMMGIKDFIKNIEYEITRLMQLKFNYFKKQLFKEMTALILILTGLIFLSIALTFLFIEYFQLSKTISFTIIGIIILIIGILFKI